MEDIPVHNIKVHIEMLDSKSIDLKVPRGTTIGQIKNKINKQTGLIAKNMVLYEIGSGDEKELVNTHRILSEDDISLFLLLNNLIDPVIACGYEHSLFIDELGKVYSCGDNWIGQLGHGNKTNSLAPKLIRFFNENNQKITAISCGTQHSLFLDKDRMVYSCGINDSGQLGHGNETEELTPKPINFFNENEIRIIAFACGGSTHSLFLDEEGMVYSCGSNDHGQLGHGNQTKELTPKPINFFNENEIPIVAVACGGMNGREFSLFVDEAGTVYSCGHNDNGQLGHGNSRDSLVPKPIDFFNNTEKCITAISCGTYSSMFLDKTGTVYSCGSNHHGQLGYSNNNMMEFTPKRISFFNENHKKVTSISCGHSHSLFLDEVGKVYGCGINNMGQLGYGCDNISKSLTIPEPNNFFNDREISITSIATGGHSSFFCDELGEMYSCGRNNFGQLGLNRPQADYRHIPEKIPIKDTNAAIQLQSLGRMQARRKSYLRKQSAITKLQSLRRMQARRKSYLRKQSAITKLQSLRRMQVRRKSYLRKRSTAKVYSSRLQIPSSRRRGRSSGSAAVHNHFLRLDGSAEKYSEGPTSSTKKNRKASSPTERKKSTRSHSWSPRKNRSRNRSKSRNRSV